jgi:hypothetical protein
MTAAARGADFLHLRNASPAAHWLNIGIAGHRDLQVGQVWVATRVIGPNPDECWRLGQPAGLACLHGDLQTFSRPVIDYPLEAACDMEAAGFVARARLYTALEKIQVLKIISDNRANPIEGINAKMVRSLIEGQADFIQQYIERILRDDV